MKILKKWRILLPSKLQYYAELAEKQAGQVTSNVENWTSFLNTSGRLYKYPFDEQLLIHAQRPDAVACAPLETWNKPMNRYVKRGSKGIAIIDQTSEKPRLRYVFDYSDTIDGRVNARKPFIWDLKPQHEQDVKKAFASNHEFSKPESNIGEMILTLAQELATRYYKDNTRDIQYSIEGSNLEEFDELNVSAIYRNAVATSVAYSVMTRCGIDHTEYIEDEDFRPVSNFNTSEAVYMLGKGVSTVSEEILREIEVVVKNHERQQTAKRSDSHERDYVHEGRGLSDTKHSSAGKPPTEQIRDVEEIVSQRTPTNTVQQASTEGGIISSLPRDRGHGERTAGSGDGTATGAETSTRQSDRPIRLDSTHEQSESPSRRDDSRRADLQLEPEELPQETDISEETSSDLGGVSSSSEKISSEEIDGYLATGSVMQDSKYRIFSFFLNEHTTKEKIDFLKDEYGYGGQTYYFADGVHGRVQASPSDGITIVKGGYNEPSMEARVTWANAAKRIDKLVSENRYMTETEMNQLSAYERKILGSEAIHFFRGLPSDIPAPSVIGNDFTDFWNRASEVGNSLDNPETLSELLAAMRPILENTPDSDRYYNTRKRAFDGLTAFENGTFTLFPNTLTLPKFPTEQEQADSIRQMEVAEIASQAHNITTHDVDDTQHNGEITTENPSQTEEITSTHSSINFRITDDTLGEGGAKTKYGFNVEAIKTLQTIEAENRFATSEEQGILSRYVGWGGIPQAFDANNANWTKEYTELKGLLTPDEHESAQASTLNAHYTSPTVIKAMYETLERLEVKNGNILEPSMGVGNFFGLIPESMENAKLYGVELDSVTGRIAKQLYQKSDIKIMGFEKTDMPDAFFDAAIGNVPFGSYKIVDRKYDKNNFLIHDYFFAKTLDKVRPGGIIAFITSRGTLDKANPEVRKYIAQRAELLGAVRLPNNAFKANAGTEVTSDIIFLQKRDRLVDIQPDWVHLTKTDDEIPVNSYFVDNPHMMLGTMSYDGKLYAGKSETTCEPIEGANLGDQLREALSHIKGKITEVELDDIEGIQDVSIPADPTVRNFSFTIVDDAVYFRENSRMKAVDMPSATLERVKGMAELRDCVRELIDFQLHEYPDADIREKQSELNTLYDDFTKKYGLINASANKKAFSEDSGYYLLCSLEFLDENGKLERKSDMFSKRTIKQNAVITSVDTSSEALAVSIGQKAKVDIDYMASLTGFTPEKIMQDLEGIVFCDIGNPDLSLPDFDPETMKVYEKYPTVTADEYLSGNVRDKLAKAKEFQETVGNMFHGINVDKNVKSLEQAQPKELEAGDIAVRLGSTWVDKKYVQEFMEDLLKPTYFVRDSIKVQYSEQTASWNISGKTRAGKNDILSTVTFGTGRMNAFKIMEDTLNLKDVQVFDTTMNGDGKEVRILNKKETMLAAQKQDAIKQAFKDWVFKEPERRQELVATYNERFNSTRPREYDGSHIQFSGISPEITLKPHQTAAIARILYGGNTLLAHEVGAGKTFEMVGAAMESKRLGLCNKSLMAVPNHLTEQMASEFLRLYPAANILVATKRDFEMQNRKKFCAKIATGDYDAVIIGHSQLERIPLSKERQERLLREQIDEITSGIYELRRFNGERFSIKQLEKTKKSLQVKLDKLTNDNRKDDVVTFEQLGVDRLFVDESHNFKELCCQGSF
jgi:N12 class adenine-specific DNA methylase/adenine-specific DNA methylase